MLPPHTVDRGPSPNDGARARVKGVGYAHQLPQISGDADIFIVRCCSAGWGRADAIPRLHGKLDAANLRPEPAEKVEDDILRGVVVDQ